MYLLYSRPASVTGRALRNMLGISGGYEPEEPESCSDLLIRWGSRAGVGIKPNRVVNYRSPLSKVSSKTEFFTLATNKYLPIPRWGWTASDIGGYPCLGRLDNLSGGEGIKYLFNQTEDEGYEFYTEYIPIEREFRVHVFNDQCITLQEKVREDGQAGTSTGFIPRNHSNGYVFSRKDTKYYPVVASLGVAAVAITGLDFGAVDIAIDGNTQALRILEVNSAPSLEGTTLTEYAVRLGAVCSQVSDSYSTNELASRCADYLTFFEGSEDDGEE